MKTSDILLTAMLVAAISPSALAQGVSTQQERPLVLHAKTSADTLVPPVGGILGSIRCDTRGNLYWLSEAGHLLRVSSDGTSVVTFDFSNVPEYRRAPNRVTVSEFALSSDDSLSVLVKVDPDVYVWSFNSDGRYQSATKLETPEFFEPAQFAVFGNGSYLLAGQVPQLAQNESPKPFAGIFNGSGQLVKRVTFTSDDQKKEEGRATENAMRYINTGNILISRDGNAYIMRSFRNPLVYVLSPAGEVLRVLRITSPDGFVPTVMVPSDNQIVITFQKRNKQEVEMVYGVYNSSDGQRAAEYTRDKELRGILACYTNNEFTFLGVQGEKRVIVRAEP